MTVKEFRTLPFLRHFDLNEYEISGIIDEANLKNFIYHNAVGDVVNNIKLTDFMSSSVSDDYTSEVIHKLVCDVMHIDENDLDVVGRNVVIKNLDIYTSTVNDYEIKELDLENKQLILVVVYS